MVNAFDILEERGFLYQLTDADALKRLLAQESVSYYVGFDPTADSLHIGHLLPVMAMRWLQLGGHRPIALVGGATAMVGDPSGKTEARPILSTEEIAANAVAIQGQLGRYLDFTEGQALLVNNADWLAGIKYIDFLRDVGRHFSINRMLSAESVKQRLETGLSFLEFNYMLLQAYDFYVLKRDEGCKLQLGGQDQWGNIIAGVDLTRRMLGEEVFGATFPLLLKSDGEKFGKSASGAVWLDPARTSPYDYYQFWRNVDDGDVEKLLAFFTMLPMDEVKRLAALEAPAINRSKEILAYEATLLAHGAEEARKAFVAAGTEFGFADPKGDITTSSAVREIRVEERTDDLPTHTVTAAALEEGMWVVGLFAESGLCKSNSDARRLIRGGGCYLNGERMTDDKYTVTAADVVDGQIMLRAGKKNLRRVVVA
ncbi:MAG: tyrosine--tRNA ligase [Lentisphaerae bacterium]|jgi:tyrosyl-tRNA synthetase|nr:tyrosine--tRNA ligase [Lentisphaerota bacterium]MBT5605028.1 tyrosine--tRNA ligase [Lentisphaerota bacterium]MBT7054658.1 tyrosine--tRNA ligase [Lentisphaerota bacterium]MBT7844687.1 tyrosine--tRNA ligase [Lentisphaerota bacterium]